MSSVTISADQAEELYESSDGDRVGDWTRITDQTVGSGRWREQHWLVITDGGGTYGIPFAVGLTENQDHEFPWAPDWGTKPEAIVLTPLVGVQVTSTEYLTEEQYKRRLGGAT
jgi:hypothetical protein